MPTTLESYFPGYNTLRTSLLSSAKAPVTLQDIPGDLLEQIRQLSQQIGNFNFLPDLPGNLSSDLDLVRAGQQSDANQSAATAADQLTARLFGQGIQESTGGNIERSRVTEQAARVNAAIAAADADRRLRARETLGGQQFASGQSRLANLQNLAGIFGQQAGQRASLASNTRGQDLGALAQLLALAGGQQAGDLAFERQQELSTTDFERQRQLEEERYQRELQLRGLTSGTAVTGGTTGMRAVLSPSGGIMYTNGPTAEEARLSEQQRQAQIAADIERTNALNAAAGAVNRQIAEPTSTQRLFGQSQQPRVASAPAGFPGNSYFGLSHNPERNVLSRRAALLDQRMLRPNRIGGTLLNSDEQLAGALARIGLTPIDSMTKNASVVIGKRPVFRIGNRNYMLAPGVDPRGVQVALEQLFGPLQNRGGEGPADILANLSSVNKALNPPRFGMEQGDPNRTFSL